MGIETNKRKKPREVGKVFQEISRKTVSEDFGLFWDSDH